MGLGINLLDWKKVLVCLGYLGDLCIPLDIDAQPTMKLTFLEKLNNFFLEKRRYSIISCTINGQ